MHSENISRLTAACLEMIQALSEKTGADAFTSPTKPEEIPFSTLMGSIVSLSEKASGLDSLKGESCKVLGSFGSVAAGRRLSEEVCQRASEYHDPGMEPVERGMLKLIDVVGSAAVNLAASGVPTDTFLHRLELWRKELEHASSSESEPSPSEDEPL